MHGVLKETTEMPKKGDGGAFLSFLEEKGGGFEDVLEGMAFDKLKNLYYDSIRKACGSSGVSR